MRSGTELEGEFLSELYIWGWNMQFQKPVVLLLGGLLTASGIGCSAASALFTDVRPAQTVHKSSSERMLAIGRMFEEQGRLDRAEAMYRGAVKKNPRDQVAREFLANVQTRRRSPQSGDMSLAAKPAVKQTPTKPVSTAAPSARIKASTAAATTPPAAVQKPEPKPQAPKPAVPPVQAPPASQTQSPAAPTAVPATAVSATKVSEQQLPAQPPTVTPASQTAPAPVSAAATPAPAADSKPGPAVPEPQLPDFSATIAADAAPAVPSVESGAGSAVVTLEHVLEAVEAPASQKSVLIRALQSGDTPEAQCLAAALLGECSAEDAEVIAALENAGTKSDDPCLVLAVMDSQLNFGKPHTGTASNLLRLLPISDAETQIQGITSLRHFAGTESRGDCVKYLSGLLESENTDVRAAATLTLGDMGPLPAETIERLEAMSKEDGCDAVRESAAATLARPLK